MCVCVCEWLDCVRWIWVRLWAWHGIPPHSICGNLIMQTKIPWLYTLWTTSGVRAGIIWVCRVAVWLQSLCKFFLSLMRDWKFMRWHIFVGYGSSIHFTWIALLVCPLFRNEQMNERTNETKPTNHIMQQNIWALLSSHVHTLLHNHGTLESSTPPSNHATCIAAQPELLQYYKIHSIEIETNG